MKLYHNSRDYNCRSALGAQICSSKLSIRLFASYNNLCVTLRTWQGHEKKYKMKHIEAGCYEANITLRKVLAYIGTIFA